MTSLVSKPCMLLCFHRGWWWVRRRCGGEGEGLLFGWLMGVTAFSSDNYSICRFNPMLLICSRQYIIITDTEFGPCHVFLNLIRVYYKGWNQRFFSDNFPQNKGPTSIGVASCLQKMKIKCRSWWQQVGHSWGWFMHIWTQRLSWHQPSPQH